MLSPIHSVQATCGAIPLFEKTKLNVVAVVVAKLVSMHFVDGGANVQSPSHVHAWYWRPERRNPTIQVPQKGYVPVFHVSNGLLANQGCS